MTLSEIQQNSRPLSFRKSHKLKIKPKNVTAPCTPSIAAQESKKPLSLAETIDGLKQILKEPKVYGQQSELKQLYLRFQLRAAIESAEESVDRIKEVWASYDKILKRQDELVVEDKEIIKEFKESVKRLSSKKKGNVGAGRDLYHLKAELSQLRSKVSTSKTEGPDQLDNTESNSFNIIHKGIMIFLLVNILIVVPLMLPRYLAAA